MNADRLRSLLTYMALSLQSGIYSVMKHGPLAKPRSFPFLGDWYGASKNSVSISKALMENFVQQFNPSSCSVASTAVVLNSARSLLGLGSPPNSITQQQILSAVHAVHWKARVSEKGHHGRRGLPIELLGVAVEQTFRHFNIPYREIRTVSLTHPIIHSNLRKKELLYRLHTFDIWGDSFIVAHFNQGVFIPGIHLPHISPVGGYDAKRRRLLILDVDPQQDSPYWVSFDTFFEALCWGYGGFLKPYGYTGGGYVWIRMGTSPR